MTNPVSRSNVLPYVISDTVKDLLDNERGKLPTGDSSRVNGLISVQKDLDTLWKTNGKGVTAEDFTKDLQATGLSANDAKNQAKSLIAAAGKHDGTELQNELATLLKKQGGATADDAQALANSFVRLETTEGGHPDSFQTEEQATNSGVDARPPSTAAAAPSTAAAGDTGTVSPSPFFVDPNIDSPVSAPPNFPASDSPPDSVAQKVSGSNPAHLTALSSDTSE